MTTAASAPPDPPDIERAALYLYQLYDIAFGIDLERAHTLLKAPATTPGATPTARVRPVVTRGGSIEIPQLPLEISLGDQTIELAGVSLSARIHMRVYDLGILAFRMMISLPDGVSWDTAAALLGAAQNYSSDVLASFQRHRDAYLTLLQPALERPYAHADRAEDYAILMIERLGAGVPAAELARDPVMLRTALAYGEADKGGHYAAFEQPEILVGEIRTGLRSLRFLEPMSAGLTNPHTPPTP